MQAKSEVVKTVSNKEDSTFQNSRKSESSTKSQVFVDKEVKAYFSDIPELAAVAYCESRYRHVDADGNIFRGVVNNKDVGVMQINEYYHLEDSKELGFDIYTLKGNMAYARHIYETSGLQPWVSSKPCWGSRVAKLNSTELAIAK